MCVFFLIWCSLCLLFICWASVEFVLVQAVYLLSKCDRRLFFIFWSNVVCVFFISGSFFFFFFYFPYKSLCSRSEIIKSPSDLCSLHVLSFLLDLIINLYRCIGQIHRKSRNKKKPSEPQKPVTVHRTGQLDRGPCGSLLFLYGTVLHPK